MMCRTAENVVEKLSVKQVFAGWSKVTKVVTVANLLYTTRTKNVHRKLNTVEKRQQQMTGRSG
jgi:hypothetical protein